MPDLVILPAHDPGAADRLAQATGQPPVTPRQLTATRPTHLPYLTPHPRWEKKMTIDTLEAVQLGDTHAVDPRPRGEMPPTQCCLLIQQGPGLPMINEVRRFEHLLGLEQDFTVVYWDQRGCGRSLRGIKDPADISVELMVDDTVSLLELLRDRFGRSHTSPGFRLERRSARTPQHSARTWWRRWWRWGWISTV